MFVEVKNIASCQDQVHRLDGPAVIFPDGREQWWQNGKRMSEAQIKLRRFMMAERVLGVVDEKSCVGR